MKSIENFSFISDTNGEEFSNNVKASIDKMQENGLEVEIQYSTTQHENSVVFSCIILGRRELFKRAK